MVGTRPNVDNHETADRRTPNLRHGYAPEDQRFPAFFTEFVKFRKDEQMTLLLKYEDDGKCRKNESTASEHQPAIGYCGSGPLDEFRHEDVDAGRHCTVTCTMQREIGGCKMFNQWKDNHSSVR